MSIADRFYVAIPSVFTNYEHPAIISIDIIDFYFRLTRERRIIILFYCNYIFSIIRLHFFDAQSRQSIKEYSVTFKTTKETAF
jgi:hypothetical protein